MSSLRQSRVHGRRALLFAIGLVIVVALIVVFAGTLTRSTTIEAQAERAEAEIAVLQARVAAGQAEIAFFKSGDFIRQQARAIGWGQRQEKAFKLPDGAPSPEPIEPIGPQGQGRPAKAPFDAWIDLLFGA